MIKNIKFNNCTPYRRAEISDCKKINFIFGANGSGKSTISSFLAGITDTRYSSSSIEWTGEIHEKIEVYNKAFRIANLQQDMPGIFTLGSATIDDIKALEELKATLEQKTKVLEGNCNSYKAKETQKSNRENQFKEDAWLHILKGNETDFQKAFEGFRNSKERFVIELKNRIAGIPNNVGTICNRQDLLHRAETIYASRMEKHNRFIIDMDKPLKNVEDIRNDEIWNKVIVGSKDVDISALINVYFGDIEPSARRFRATITDE